jgi:hypothetical protein
MKLSLPGFQNLTRTIQNLQGISEEEAIVVSDRLVNELSERLDDGQKLAFLDDAEDGSMDITIIDYFIKRKRPDDDWRK